MGIKKFIWFSVPKNSMNNWKGELEKGSFLPSKSMYRQCTLFRKAYILSGSVFHKFLYSIIESLKKTREIAEFISNQLRFHVKNFSKFAWYGNQSSGSTKSLHWLISFAACSLISGQLGRLNNFCSNMLKIMFFCTFRLYHEN